LVLYYGWFQNFSMLKTEMALLISYFCHVLNVVFFLLGDSTASEFYVPTFWNTLSHLHRRRLYCPWRRSVLKRRHIKFGHQEITKKKKYNRNSPVIVETYSRMNDVCLWSHIMLTNSIKFLCFHFLCDCFQVWTLVSHKAANPKHQHKQIHDETQ
jgi:hypothetical protein